MREDGEDIVDALDQVGTIAQELVGTAGPRVERRAGHRHHLAALLSGIACGDQRAGPQRGLDHQRTKRQAGYKPVSTREIPRRGRSSQWHFRQKETGLTDSFVQGGMLGRIDVIDPASENRNRPALDRAGMGGPVYAAGQAGDDDEVFAAQPVCQLAGKAQPHGRGVAGTDQGAARALQQGQVAAHDDRRWWSGDGCEQGRVDGVKTGDEAGTGALDLVELGFDAIWAGDIQSAVTGGTGAGRQVFEGRFGVSIAGNGTGKARGAQSPCPREAQPHHPFGVARPRLCHEAGVSGSSALSLSVSLSLSGRSASAVLSFLPPMRGSSPLSRRLILARWSQ